MRTSGRIPFRPVQLSYALFLFQMKRPGKSLVWLRVLAFRTVQTPFKFPSRATFDRAESCENALNFSQKINKGIIMSYNFKYQFRNWIEYRKLANLVEVDFHPQEGGNGLPYWERMEEASSRTISALREAQKAGKQYVLFTHGSSTSHRGKTTCRSQVRSVMRSKEATALIMRGACIQQDSVFLAAIRPLDNSEQELTETSDASF